jgi:hypothetical protein
LATSTANELCRHEDGSTSIGNTARYEWPYGPNPYTLLLPKFFVQPLEFIHPNADQTSSVPNSFSSRKNNFPTQSLSIGQGHSELWPVSKSMAAPCLPVQAAPCLPVQAAQRTKIAEGLNKDSNIKEQHDAAPSQ